MPQNFFITGLPKAGKTTLLHRVMGQLKDEGLKVGGFISPEERHHGTRTGFYAMDIGSGRIGRLADLECDGPRVSKYHVDIASFEDVVLAALEGFAEYDVIIIDEIGWMELKSRRFSELLDGILESDTPLIASLHEDFVGRYGPYGEVIELSEGNREEVATNLLEEIKAIHKKTKKAPGGKRAQVPVKPERKGKAEKKPASKKATKLAAKKPAPKKRIPEKPAARKPGARTKKKGFLHGLRELIGV